MKNITAELDDFVIADSESIHQYELSSILNKVILGDATQVLQKIPDGSVDLVFMDPPYFLQLPKKKLRRWDVRSVVNGVDDSWDKFGSFEDYDKFIQTLLVELQRIMKTTASIWVIATYHSLFRIGKIMQDLGFWVLNDVHWVKTNPMPNWLGVRFTNATETMIWAVKDKKTSKYTFNKQCAREFGIGKIGANVWMIPSCTGKERLKDAQGNKIHSTQKPMELVRRVILSSTKKHDIILDPVAGVGTTGVVAHQLQRNFILIDINKNYVDATRQRFLKQCSSNI